MAVTATTDRRPPGGAPPGTALPDLPPEGGQPPPRLPWKRIDTVALLVLLLLAGGVRLYNLWDPPDLVFDETHYAKDACWIATQDPELCGVSKETNWVHPPLGKSLISLGIAVLGHDSTGRRITPALAGIISVALLFLIARKLLRSTAAAFFAGLLLAFDLLHFVQSRIAMLDIFLALFALLAVFFLLKDRDRMQEATEEPAGEKRSFLARPWRAAAGAAAGAATASKWSGALVLLLVLVLTLVWELAAEWRRRRRPEGRSVGRVLLQEGPSVILFLLVLPVVVYAASYIGHTPREESCAEAEGWWLKHVWERQGCMYEQHRNGFTGTSHRYESPAWSWILLKRPVAYFFCSGETCKPAVAEGDYVEIMATGSPFVWWSSILALLYVFVRWIRRRNWRGPEGMIVAGFFFTYLPWIFLAGDRSAVFIFYLLPAVPFMCLAIAYVAHRLGTSWEARIAGALFAAISVALFAFYYPVLAKVPIPYPSWQKRIWIFESCDKPAAKILPNTVTVTKPNGNVSTSVGSTAEDQSSIPPEGWCWI